MSTMRVHRTLAVAVGLAVSVVLFSCSYSSDLSGTLSGTVRRSGYPTPISGARVECAGTATFSDSDGSYSLEGISPGDRVVYASASGYDDYSAVVSVGELTLHDIYMETETGQARVYGHVIHAALDDSLEGAEVRINQLLVLTDSEGFYEYPNLEQHTSYDLTVTKEGYRGHEQTITPNSEQYQVNVTLKKLKTIEIASGADASVMMSHSHVNFGDEPELLLFNNQVMHESFYIAFSTDGIEESAEPSSAVLWLYNTPAGGEEPREILVGSVLYHWMESAVTWANGPETSGASTVPSVYEDSWYQIDVTTFFSDWLLDEVTNNGLLVDTTVDLVASRFVFASREYEEEDKRPHVILEYAW